VYLYNCHLYIYNNFVPHAISCKTSTSSLKDQNADIRNTFGGKNATRFNRDADSDVVETATSETETETWLKFGDETETLS